MTEDEAYDRVTLIRTAWETFGKLWDWRKIGLTYKMPLPQLTLGMSPGEDIPLPDEPIYNVQLRFHLSFETICGHRGYIIRCEGVVVEQGLCSDDMSFINERELRKVRK